MISLHNLISIPISDPQYIIDARGYKLVVGDYVCFTVCGTYRSYSTPKCLPIVSIEAFVNPKTNIVKYLLRLQGTKVIKWSDQVYKVIQ